MWTIFLVIHNCKNLVFMKGGQREQSWFRIETAKVHADIRKIKVTGSLTNVLMFA